MRFSALGAHVFPRKTHDTAQQLILLCTKYTSNREIIYLPPRRLQILLVDAVINRDIIGEMLVSFGPTHVTIAAGSNEALTLSQQQRFDLVLIDIRMPK